MSRQIFQIQQKQATINIFSLCHVVSKLNKYKNDFNSSEVKPNIYTLLLHSKGTPTCNTCKVLSYLDVFYTMQPSNNLYQNTTYYK